MRRPILPEPISINVVIPVVIPAERMETHDLSLESGTQARAMFMCGAFGLHPEKRRDGRSVWRVTHAATGLCVKDFASLPDAAYAAGVLMGTGFDWTTIGSLEGALALRGTEPWRAVAAALREHCGHLVVEK